MRITLLCTLSAALLLPACGEDPPIDELGEESATDGEAGKGDSVDAFTYFEVTPDIRACSLDARCGGFFVSRTNRASTTCAPGEAASRCYVDELDWAGTAMPASVAASYAERVRAGEPLLLRGEIAPGASGRRALAVTEVWVPQGDASAEGGVFVLVRDNGTRCVTAPCPSLTELRLNSSQFADIHEVDLEESGAAADVQARALDALASDGVILAGTRYRPTSTTKGRAASRFWTKAPVPLHSGVGIAPGPTATALTEALAAASADSGTLLSAETYAVSFSPFGPRDAGAVIARLQAELAYADLRQDEGTVGAGVLAATLEEYGVVDGDQRDAIESALGAAVPAPVATTRKLWLRSDDVPDADAEWAEVVMIFVSVETGTAVKLVIRYEA